MNMKQLAMAVLFAGASTSAFASCSSQLAEINRISAYLSNNSLGICQMARGSVDLYWKASEYANSCLGDGGQAAEYARAAREAQQTANASCG
jgi:hypothetical protein